MCREFEDSREGFDAETAAEYEEYLADGDWEGDEYENDGQPSEYEEWQDLYGGDDWDHGQYDNEY